MQINTKYHIEPKMVRLVLSNIRKHYLDRIPARDISALVVVEEFYRNTYDVSFQRLYNTDQLKNGKLDGKPTKMYLIKYKDDIVDRHEYVFTNVIELKKTLEFFEFKGIGLLTQVRTSFLISDDILSVPITISETNELGCFVEVGNVVGPLSNIQMLIEKFSLASGIEDDWIAYLPYQDMLSKQA